MCRSVPSHSDSLHDCQLLSRCIATRSTVQRTFSDVCLRSLPWHERKRKCNTQVCSPPPPSIALLVRSTHFTDSYMSLQFNAVSSWPIFYALLLHFQWLLSVILFRDRLPPEARDFALLQSARQALGLTHPSFQRVGDLLSIGLKRPAREADISVTESGVSGNHVRT
jgi:hypothetical protein